jgi:hypothetical protein
MKAHGKILAVIPLMALFRDCLKATRKVFLFQELARYLPIKKNNIIENDYY